MKARYCERTQDLHLFLNSVDVDSLRGEHGFVPILDSTDQGLRFWLRKYKFDLPGETAPPEGIRVNLPEEDMRSAWIIDISGEAYQEFVSQREIGTRYLNGAKLKILREEDYE